MTAAAATEHRQAALDRLGQAHRQGRLREVLDGALGLERECVAGVDDAARFQALRFAALAAVELGEFAQAFDAAETANRLADADPRCDGEKRAMARSALGWCFERVGNPWQADRLFLQAAELAREAGAERALFAALNNRLAGCIGRFHLLRDTDDLPAARAMLLESLPLGREALALPTPATEPLARAVILGNLGEVLVHLGDLEAAYVHLNEAVRVAEREGLPAQRLRIAVTLAEAALAEGRPADAIQILCGSEAGPCDGTFGEDRSPALAAGAEPITRLRAHRVLALAAESLGRPVQALAHLKAHIRLERERSAQQLRAQSRLLVLRREADQARHALHAEQRQSALLARQIDLDPLTGVANRRALEARLEAASARSAAESRPLSLAMLDLDHFKRVNDCHGHAVGDEVLRRVCRVASRQLRAGDLLARYGGEEFVVLLPDTGQAAAAEVAERLLRSIESEPWSELIPGLGVTTCIGVATGTGEAGSRLLERADVALYVAKSAGRNRVEAA